MNENLSYVYKHSPSLQTRGNPFYSTISRCKKCHIPISVTPVKSAASPICLAGGEFDLVLIGASFSSP